MVKQRSPIITLLLSTFGVGAILLSWLAGRVHISTWANAAQVVAMVGTLVALVGVWSQLAVQTVASIFASSQDEAIRKARGRLFAAEDTSKISSLRCVCDPDKNQWKEDWKLTADEVSQNWNSTAYLLKIDPIARYLIATYIAKTRKAILRSHFIALPRILQRRSTFGGGQSDLWRDFDWLANIAAKKLQTYEAKAWNLPPDYLTWLGDNDGR